MTSEGAVGPDTVLAFWRAAGPDKWFEKDDAFDAEIRARFLATYEAAAAGRLTWGETPDGALALLIVLDQFPRNMFRDSARAFAADRLARTVASRAIARGFDQVAAARSAPSSICRSSIPKRLPIRSAASRSIGRPAMRMRSNGPKFTPTSSAGSAASRIETRRSAAPPRPRSTPSWTAAGSRGERITAERFVALAGIARPRLAIERTQRYSLVAPCCSRFPSARACRPLKTATARRSRS